jgi:hypothetical protein
VAGSIIAKLPSSWKDFATFLKHKRQEFSVAELTGSLDVEERARAKDNVGKELSLPLPIWCRRKTHLHLVIKKEEHAREQQCKA